MSKVNIRQYCKQLHMLKFVDKEEHNGLMALLLNEAGMLLLTPSHLFSDVLLNNLFLNINDLHLWHLHIPLVVYSTHLLFAEKTHTS